MTGLPYHPLANLFPLIEGAAFAEMVADVRANGLRERIYLLDGMILDGRNRYRAAIAAGLLSPEADPLTDSMLRIKHFALYIRGDKGDPLAWVLSRNLHRRHLTESQRAMVAAKIANMGPGRPAAKSEDWRSGAQTQVAPENPAHLPVYATPAISQSVAAERLAVSERSVRTARTVVDHGAPELAAAVDRGEVSVSAAAAITTLPETEQQEIVARGVLEILAAAKAINRAKAERRHGERLQKHAAIATGNGPLPTDRRYCVIYADPPWENEVYSEVTGALRSPDYPTMPLADIMAMAPDIRAMASDAGCALYLWVTTNRLDDGIDFLRACGFDYVSSLVWDKVQIGLGRWVRDRHETLLIGRLGDIPCPLPGTQPHSVWREQKGEHSAKPAGIRDVIAAMFPAVPKIELFARGPIEGWSVWGNQAEGQGVPASVLECARRGRAGRSVAEAAE